TAYIIDEHSPYAKTHTLSLHDALPISDIRDKIALFADVDVEAVISNEDVPDVYLVPAALQAQGLDELVCRKLGLPEGEAELGERSEEHTSELQSPYDLVCRLLLEKKKV